ncbi:hypothetical protein [Janthinobacterium sp. PAMC25594]|uniref:hypothetical protein n=1 Tax=Janthinobacterium sp. PAMC25594 TaxID=2861284 RepID=UPI001C624F54|nr:hypothetical protein [Janthinobacterium sp. PAMC25594]QYG06051.1 hypothetical protein KY494_22605 [Janthinobacterium sp. PAMC25594]
MSKITERLKHLIGHVTSEAKKFKELEAATEITSGTWRSWWNRSGSPSGEMIEAVSTAWPEYAFWLATGNDDPMHGHHAPGLNKHIRTRSAARDLFLAQQELGNWIAINKFGYNEFAETVKLDQNLDDENNRKVREFNKLRIKVEALESIRNEQEASLRKFEEEEFMKEFFGYTE